MSQIVILLSLFVSTSVLAFSLPLIEEQDHQPLLLSSRHNNIDFEGIVKLSNCSAALVTLEGQASSDYALVATNGHCLRRGFLNPDQQIVYEANNRSMTLYDTNRRSYRVRAQYLVYATMSKTDFALYELNETYDEILERTGVRPFVLSSQRPREGTPIDIVSGYWSRLYQCDIDQFVFKLKEDRWAWSDSIRYTPGCNTIGGTSGSPLIERGTRTVIGVNNTSYTGGARCSLHNPCEVDQTGQITVRQQARYGQQTYWIYSCLNQNGKIDLTVEGCRLPY